MHVAVCDDNIADRKQTERLLGRESDRRAKITEGLFVDSYGNANTLLTKPMQYDIFYIDMCKTELTEGACIARKLCDAGVQAPIYMCCSEIDYRQFDLPENVHFLDKPLKAEMLISSLDHAYEVKQHAVPMIELRLEKETLYVTERDILYATEDGRNSQVTLTNGQKVRIATDIANLFDQWIRFDTFFSPNLKTIVNCRYISKVGILHIHMSNSTKFALLASCRKHALYAFKTWGTSQ